MKIEYKKKLLVVFDTICYNLESTIGWHIRPTLYFSYKEYEKHLKAFEEGGGLIDKPAKETPYGEIVWNAKAIYVNPTNCVYIYEDGHK
jgi:hypothetical protein